MSSSADLDAKGATSNSSKPSSAASSTSTSPLPGSMATATNSTTSTSPATTPSPLIIAKSFIKQYYQVLTTSPSHIHRFYKPTSQISHSFSPSLPAKPQPLQASLFDWASSCEGGSLRLDLEHGTMDAHTSVQEGILVVVTGHMTLPSANKARQFVHTFFLNGAPVGKKRQFYVHNDILRFVDKEDDETEGVESVEEVGVEEAPPKDVVVQDKAVEEPVEETPIQEVVTSEDAPLEVIEEDSKGETVVASNQSMEHDKVEEEEEPVVDVVPPKKSEEETATTSKKKESETETPVEPKKSRKKSKSGRFRKDRKDRSSSPTDANGKSSKGNHNNNNHPAEKKAKRPGSWASLVAGGAAPNTSSSSTTPPSPSRPSPAAAAAATTAAKIVQEEDVSPPPPMDNKKKVVIVQRTPEATLFLKNIADKTKESDIRALFEPYATNLGQSILEITLHASRGFCFVDFDHRSVVDTILAEAESAKKDGAGSDKKDLFFILGKKLDLGRKVAPAEKGRGGGASSNRFGHRSSSPGNGSFPKSQRGGRRRSSPRGGNRSNRQQSQQQTQSQQNDKSGNATASK